MKKTTAWQSVEFAERIANRRRDKYIKNKGRKLTPRSHRQYINGRLYDDIKQIFLNADKTINQNRSLVPSGIASNDTDDKYNQLLIEIRKTLAREYQQRGRPRKSKGIVNSVMNKRIKRNGRPRTVDPDAEQVWTHRLWAVATVLWADKEGLLGKATLSAILETLMKQPDWQRELHALFPDAIRTDFMQPFNPPAKNIRSLIQRARNARNIYPLPAKLKSGG